MTEDDASRTIGKIVNVSADRLIVELHRGSDNFTIVGFDDVHYVATLGSYLMVPVKSEYVVLEVIGLSEKDFSPAHGGKAEMDKTTAAKFLDVIPVGSMPVQGGSFHFGVSTFPPLYADTLYAREEDLDRIFNVERRPDRKRIKDAEGDFKLGSIPHTIEIGTSTVFKGYPVKAQIGPLFGGHIAVLGNTGSGKSCTVASVFQSVLMKPDEFGAIGSAFIIFDVNGEYRQALNNLPDRIESGYLKATEPGVEISHSFRSILSFETQARFRLPHWFMTFDEWALLLRASEKSQQPALRTALGLTTLFEEDQIPVVEKDGNDTKTDSLESIRNHVLARIILSILQSEESSVSASDRITSILATFKTKKINIQLIGNKISIHYGKMFDPKGLADYLSQFVQNEPDLPVYENNPFSFERLQVALDLALYYEEANGNKQIRDYCSQMMTRLKSVTRNRDFEFLTANAEDLEDYECDPVRYVDYLLGISKKNDGYRKKRQICIIDLNDASDEIVELASAVVARLIFDRMRRAEPRNKMPVHLILEEAHRYISEKPGRFAIDAGITFQRIAKEGRKYGAFLIVASQRPSELSKTVLSQCNNFIIHRIQNPDDLSQIRQMTPFISETVLKRLPSLPKQHALIFGNAVNIPMTFRVRDADPTPHSADTNIRELWYVPDDPVLLWKTSGSGPASSGSP